MWQWHRRILIWSVIQYCCGLMCHQLCLWWAEPFLKEIVWLWWPRQTPSSSCAPTSPSQSYFVIVTPLLTLSTLLSLTTNSENVSPLQSPNPFFLFCKSLSYMCLYTKPLVLRFKLVHFYECFASKHWFRFPNWVCILNLKWYHYHAN